MCEELWVPLRYLRCQSQLPHLLRRIFAFRHQLYIIGCLQFRLQLHGLPTGIRPQYKHLQSMHYYWLSQLQFGCSQSVQAVHQRNVSEFIESLQ